MRRLALAARMAADTAVRDSIVPLPSASRLPELGPHGEGWLALQLLLGAAIAGVETISDKPLSGRELALKYGGKASAIRG